MIKINSDFSISKDAHGRTLTETKMQRAIKGKYSGEERETKTQTYHPNFEKIATAINDRIDGGCESLEELKELYKDSEKAILGHIKFIYKDDIKGSKKSNTGASETLLNDDLENDLESDLESDSEIAEKPTKSIKKRRKIKK